ncbi:MAG: DUF502 domain-containing protein [Elainellaceae cyanobacterium]
MLQQIKQDLKNDLIAGLLVIIPLATTIWLSFTLASWAIKFLTRVPKQINPFNDLNPILSNLLNLGVGFAAPLLFIMFIGLMARNIAGRWLLDVGERILQAIPLAGSVYKTLKQILETLLRDSNNKFRRVVLVEYPRRGIWALAFVTGTVRTNLQGSATESMLSVIIPTTPNPTSGWFAIVPEQDVINLDISIEDAFKLLISGGIVGPSLLSVNSPAPASVIPSVASGVSANGADMTITDTTPDLMSTLTSDRPDDYLGSSPVTDSPVATSPTSNTSLNTLQNRPDLGLPESLTDNLDESVNVSFLSTGGLSVNISPERSPNDIKSPQLFTLLPVDREED